MKWIELAVYTTDEGIEGVAGALASVGLEQVSIEESSERVAAFLQETAPYWDYADPAALAAKNGPCVKAYVADLPENQSLLQSAREAIERLRGLDTGLAMGSLALRETRMDEEDWANSWKAYYKPLNIGERLLVCPSWEEADPDGRVLLRMDPGMMFGTGAHHTTRLCLQAIEERISGGERMLDVGCGSGILAIAGLLLGAKEAALVDVDPAADRVVGENMAANAIDPARYRIHVGDVLRDAGLRASLGDGYDLVAANIVADVIIALCPYVPAFLKPDGIFLCSGIIDERREDVRNALQKNGFQLIGEWESEGWLAALACRMGEGA